MSSETSDHEPMGAEATPVVSAESSITMTERRPSHDIDATKDHEELVAPLHVHWKKNRGHSSAPDLQGMRDGTAEAGPSKMRDEKPAFERKNTKAPQRSTLTNDTNDPSRAQARRMVRAHTRGPVPHPGSSDEEAVSLRSGRTLPDQSTTRRRRKSSASSYNSDSDDSDDSDDDRQHGPGVMSTLLGLYRPKHDTRGLDEEERMERNNGRNWKARFFSHASGGRRRRISDNALFAPSSRRSSRASSFTSDGDDSSTWSASVFDEEEGIPTRRGSDPSRRSSRSDSESEVDPSPPKRAASIADPENEKVERDEPADSQKLRPHKSEPMPAKHLQKERSSSLPSRSQDVNEPYIPDRVFSHTISPTLNTTVAQRFRAWVVEPINYLWPGVGIGNTSDTGGFLNGDRQHESYRTMAALVITTSGLAGIAHPELARFAPASGPDAETNTGQRKISRYEGLTEADAREEDEAALQLKEENGSPTQEVTEAEKVMNEGLDRGLGGKVAKAGALKDHSERRHARNGQRKNRRGKRKQNQIAITKHLSSILQRKRFIEHLAKALLNFGAPSHSLESWLDATSNVLGINASFIYFPSVLIVAFRDSDVHSTDILIMRPKGVLDLYRLALVHDIYRKVVRDEISASQGSRVLRRVTREMRPYPMHVLVGAAMVASACAARVAFSGSFIDICASAVLGAMLALVNFTLASKHRRISNVWEIVTAGFISFFARGLGSTHYFCYQSVVSASIVLILPGWIICLGALELGSRNIVAGAIRVVWAVIYTFFLSFGIGIGSQIWDAFGPEQLTAEDVAKDSSSLNNVYLTGSFKTNSSQWDQTLSNGTFTFQNGTTSDMTQVACYRDPALTGNWWYNAPSDWWLFLLVPIFAYSLAIWNRADWRSRDILVMVWVASGGFVANFFVSQHISQTNVSSAVGAVAIGVLGNMYSRMAGGSAFPSMVVGVLLLVPNAIAAAGGLSSASDDEESTNSSSINSSVIVSIRMVQTGIGLCIGLFVASLIVYPFGKRGKYIFSF